MLNHHSSGIRTLLLTVATWLLFWTAGCMKEATPPYPYPSPPMESYGYDMAETEVMMEAASAPSRAAPSMKRAPAPVAAMAPPPPPPPPPPRSTSAPTPPKPTVQATPETPARMIHYSGFARMRVVSIEETTDALTAKAKAMGGFVESVTGRVVTLRVPVDRFSEAFEALTALGEVLDRSISAEDVTEAFTAVDLRLATARRTRDRLVELLARSTDENEKLSLIAQIQRVSEDIDRMEAQLRTLSALANFSRVTLELVPRTAQAWQGPGDETAEMTWIRGLSPFRPDLVSSGKRLDLAVPDGMVQLSPKKRFIAEGPDGSRIWSGRLPNEPVGDGAFWIAAVQSRLAREFAIAEVETIGSFTVLKLTDRGDNPYSWWIAVRPDGKWLEIVEAYFPTPTERERFEGAIRSSLLTAGGAA